MLFTLGQRWISDTESELGLGTVVAIDTRMVTLLFPATGENRLYARNDSPITRVIFNLGDIVTSHEGWQLTILSIDETEGLITYIGTRTDTQEENIQLREVMLDSKLVFSKPQDRLFAGQLDRMDRFALRYRARKYQSEQFIGATSGLRGMRTNLIPHQLHIASEVGRRHAPRVLLADEVGLGKTIEAGMILRWQLLSGLAERVLIVVPETLQHQWLVEMLRRFNLHFSLFDDERYQEASLDSINPFFTEQLVICSLDFVTKNKQRLDEIASAEWDLLIVDEAHHLAWSEGDPSREYRAIEAIAEHTAGVLLLTATPEQLGMQSHFARLRLLDSSRFHDYSAFLHEQQQYHRVAEAVSQLLSGNEINTVQAAAMQELVREQDISATISQANHAGAEQAAARNELITLLTDRHGTSRVLFRNTRQGIPGFPARKLYTTQLPMPPQYQTAIKVAGMMNGKKSLDERAQAMLYPEQIYQDFEGDHGTWWGFDPRVAWLVQYLKQQRPNKILVICAKAATALQLAQVLREQEGILAAVFHEGLSILERDRAAAFFASKEEGAQVMICSEIGSEGRNFQFASQLVMFDLPINPDLLEQRIGRLDRIGQTREIEIQVPWLENTAQAILLRWYHEGLDAFEHTCPTGRTIYDNHRDGLLQLLAAPNDTADYTPFIAECQAEHQQLKSQLQQGRDRLLELNSQGGEHGEQLADAIALEDNNSELINFALNLFDIIGINQEDRSDNLLVLTPSDHMLVPDFPGLPEEGCTITFNRNQALSREDTQFITWEHPLIRNGLDLILSSDTGSCALSLLKNKALPVGTLLLELIYVIETKAPKKLQLNRFLPPTPVRILMDKNGNDLANKVDFEAFNRTLSAVNRHNGSKLVNAVQPEVWQILNHAEQLIVTVAKTHIEQATQRADSVLSHELDRLQALQKVNSAIREDEVTVLQENRQQVLTQLSEASFRLDALRLIVVTHQ
jgi:ATP-dependent helicase HepA